MNQVVDKVSLSLVRTITPWVIGTAVTLLAKAGFNWHPSAGSFVLVSQGVSAAFYAAVRFAEEKVSPKFGWLLGAVGAPSYAAGNPDAQGATA